MAPPNAPIEHPEPVLPAAPQYDEDSLIPLSALQHYLYCPRQCALIHVEQAWAENRFTAEGRVLHERTDSGKGETRHGVRTVRSLPLRSLRYGLTGIADVVEFRHTESGEQPYPVEYKRGQPKPNSPDAVQLCAQALCLEEMLNLPVPEGALFYGQRKRRTVVPIDDALRTRTLAAIRAVQSLLASTSLPEPVTDDRCRACSLLDECMPRSTASGTRASRYLANLILSP